MGLFDVFAKGAQFLKLSRKLTPAQKKQLATTINATVAEAKAAGRLGTLKIFTEVAEQEAAKVAPNAGNAVGNFTEKLQASRGNIAKPKIELLLQR